MTSEDCLASHSLENVWVILPAVKKNVAFPDDLIKKINGIPLIQRAIDLCCRAFEKDSLRVVTDSEEIALVCERSKVAFVYDAKIALKNEDVIQSLRPLVSQFINCDGVIVLVSPYSPLLNPDELRSALDFFFRSGSDWVLPVSNAKLRPYRYLEKQLSQLLFEQPGHELEVILNAFSIVSASLFLDANKKPERLRKFPVRDRVLEIASYEDWWLCEKIMQRKRIVFRVVGNEDVGMGHVYRSLSLAHEISDHEIRFVCDESSSAAVTKLAGTEYWLGVYSQDKIEEAILSLKPDMVINDILDTSREYIDLLKTNNIKVINFEDLGSGASAADVTINELYENPGIDSGNVLWGDDWLFLRDEFSDAAKNVFRDKVAKILLTFGGTDPSNHTLRVLRTIYPYCEGQNVEIVVVVGQGYSKLIELRKYVDSTCSGLIKLIHATNAMSKIMEGCDIAVCSNGRSVYELAHMNIPSIIIPHNERERRHAFASEEHGFVVLQWSDLDLEAKVAESFLRLFEDVLFRRNLFLNSRRFDFSANKNKVLDIIHGLLR